MDALRDKEANDRIYAQIPKINLKEIIVDTDTLLKEWLDHYLKETKSDHQKGLYFDKTFEEVEALKNDSKSTVAYMVKEFEMKKAADQYARAATSKTGSLDMSKLHTYKYNEDLFKKVTTLPGATNHGMVMVVDWSGSMSENLKGTLAQMYNLIWFCRRTNIPFEVFAFSDVYGGRESRANWSTDYDKIKAFKAGDIALHQGFRLLNMFSSNMSLSDEMTMMHILWMYAARFSGWRDWNELGYPYTAPESLSLGGTPLNDAIIATMDLVPQFKKDTGVQKVNTIFLTDGASNRIEGIYDYRLNKDDGSHSKIINSAPEMRWGKTKIVIIDPVINKSYEIKGDDLTNELIRILKNRVSGMNVVGFFIAGSGKSGRVDKRTLYYLLNDHDWDKTSKAIKFINKNKYLAITQLGYDEYYILPGGNALAVENETLSDDLIGAGKGKLKSAFGKIAKGKISSRQLLNKFVNMVA
jgi:Mg-chelatase subunit ChlD